MGIFQGVAGLMTLGFIGAIWVLIIMNADKFSQAVTSVGTVFVAESRVLSGSDYGKAAKN